MIYKGAGYEKEGTKADCHCHADKSYQDKADKETAKKHCFCTSILTF
jgi:hypothetical protein